MNSTSVPHPEDSICLPTYAQANANRDPEAQRQQYRYYVNPIRQKLKLFSIYVIGVLIVSGILGLAVYELYMEYRRSQVRINA